MQCQCMAAEKESRECKCNSCQLPVSPTAAAQVVPSVHSVQSACPPGTQRAQLDLAEPWGHRPGHAARHILPGTGRAQAGGERNRHSGQEAPHRCCGCNSTVIGGEESRLRGREPPHCCAGLLAGSPHAKCCPTARSRASKPPPPRRGSQPARWLTMTVDTPLAWPPLPLRCATLFQCCTLFSCTRYRSCAAEGAGGSRAVKACMASSVVVEHVRVPAAAWSKKRTPFLTLRSGGRCSAAHLLAGSGLISWQPKRPTCGRPQQVAQLEVHDAASGLPPIPVAGAGPGVGGYGKGGARATRRGPRKRPLAPEGAHRGAARRPDCHAAVRACNPKVIRTAN